MHRFNVKTPFFKSFIIYVILGAASPIFQVLYNVKNILRCIIKGKPAVVHDNNSVHIFCHVLHTVGHKHYGILCFSCTSFIIPRISSLPTGSSPAVGSSSTIYSGFIAITPAIATRLFVLPTIQRATGKKFTVESYHCQCFKCPQFTFFCDKPIF